MPTLPDPSLLRAAARTAVAAVRASSGTIGAATDAEIAAGVRALLESEAARTAGVLPSLAAFTAVVVAHDDLDVAACVPRVLQAACDLAAANGVATRMVAITVVRAAMEHPRLRGRSGDELLSALVARPGGDRPSG